MPDTTYADLSLDGDQYDAEKALEAVRAAIGSLEMAAITQLPKAAHHSNRQNRKSCRVIISMLNDLITDDLEPLKRDLEAEDAEARSRPRTPYEHAHAGHGGGL